MFQGQQVPRGPGPWIDLVVQAVLGGLPAEAIGGWISRPRKHKQGRRLIPARRSGDAAVRPLRCAEP
jgi:hypothetical protein